MSKINWKLLITIMLLLFSVWALWPSLNWLRMSSTKREEAKRMRDPILGKVIKLGLDLKGGTHLLLEVDCSRLGSSLEIKDAVYRAVEVIRNRIDQFGITEPVIAKCGGNYIIVQLPGIKDSRAAKDLIGKTALLEFRMVNTSLQAVKVLDLFIERGITPGQYYKEKSSEYADIRAIMPENGFIFESKESGKYYILDKTLLTGAAISNARVEFIDQFSQPVVSIEFNKSARKLFADITCKNIGKKLAIVLDEVVQSAPVIQSKITEGKAFIEGNFSSEDARFLATILRAGALPASVKVIEERSVGPSLGDDSIRKGFISSFVGIVIVFIFMIIYYRFSGLIADIALSLNLIVLMAIMAYFQFTVTLPGMAGIALSLAMAVDANVLILERMREELNVGKTAILALNVAYQKVFWTVFDANFTTLIVAVFLFQFGAAPIKGFAIALSIGLLVSMFTAISVTKLIYELLFKKKFLLKIKI